MLFAVSYTNAQQVPLGNLYNSNEYLINSAESAVDTIPVIFLSYRKQWAGVDGLKETPTTSMINGHMHVTQNSSLGFKFYSDQLGQINQNYGMLSYAHRFIFNPHTNFAIGLSGGVYRNAITYQNVIAEDGTDPILLAGDDSGIAFESSISFMFVYDHFKLGLAIPRLVESDLQSSGSLSNFTLDRHYMIYTRFHYDINKDYKLEPSVLYKVFPKAPDQNQFDMNLDLMYKDLFSIGGGFRTQEGIMLRASAKKDRVQVSYSYEFYNSSFTAFSKGSHEIRLGFYFGSKPVKKEQAVIEPKPVYHYEALPTEDEILLNVAVGDPKLSDELSQMSDDMGMEISTNEEDKSYIIEVPSESPNQGTRKFKLKSLYDLRRFVREFKDAPSSMSIDDKIDKSNVLLKYEIERKFETLKSADEILLKIEAKDPNLSQDIKDLSDRDDVELLLTKDGYTLDIGKDDNDKRRFVFKNLEDMNKFVLELKTKDPGLDGDLHDAIDDSQLMKNYEDPEFKFRRLKRFEEPLKVIGKRSPRLVAQIKELLVNRDDVDLIVDEKGNYSLIIGDSNSLDRRKFSFQTLGQMNTFMTKLKFADPNLKEDPITAIDDNSLLEMYEDDKFIFKQLKSSKDLMLKIGGEDPTLSQNLLDLTNDRDDIVISKDPYDRYQVDLIGKEGEKKSYKFETLGELNKFVLRLKNANPGLDDNLLDIADNSGLMVDNGKFSENDLDVIHELLYFKIGSHAMTSMAKKNVDAKIELLKTKEFKKIIIAGYTCNLGSEGLNKKLSKDRAQRIADYFISKGVPAEKIEVYGKGPEYPLVPNDTEDNRKKNRRVEFEIYF